MQYKDIVVAFESKVTLMWSEKPGGTWMNYTSTACWKATVLDPRRFHKSGFAKVPKVFGDLIKVWLESPDGSQKYYSYVPFGQLIMPWEDFECKRINIEEKRASREAKRRAAKAALEDRYEPLKGRLEAMGIKPRINRSHLTVTLNIGQLEKILNVKDDT